MPSVIIESKHLLTEPVSYSVQKIISFYSREAAERFADAINKADQGSNPDNTVKAIIVDTPEQAVNGDGPNLLHTLHVTRSTGNVEYETVEVFTRRNLEFQKSVGLNPAITHAFENPDDIAPANLTATEKDYHFLAEDRQETTDVYLSFLPDIREMVKNLLSSTIDDNLYPI
jgi:hypothetical protein